MQDSYKLIEERLFPYMIDSLNEKNLTEYKKSFNFLLDLFSLGKEKNKTSENSELLELIERKLYEAIKLSIEQEELEFSRNLIEILIDKYPIEYSTTYPFKEFNFKFREIIAKFIHKDLLNLKNYFGYKSEFLRLYKNLTLKYLENLKKYKNIKSNTLIFTYVYFYNQIIKYGLDKNLRKELIDIILPEPIDIINNEIISHYEKLILELSHYIIYNFDEYSFKILLKKLNSFYLQNLNQDIILRILTKLGIYVYYLYLESEKLFSQDKKATLKNLINESVSIGENKNISFSNILNEKIRENIKKFISLKKEIFDSSDEDVFSWELYYEGEAKFAQLPNRADEFFIYFLIINYHRLREEYPLWKELREEILKHFSFNEVWRLLDNFFDLENSSLKNPYSENFEKFLDLFYIKLDKDEAKNKEKINKNVSMFITDLGNYYKEHIFEKLKSFYYEKENLTIEIENKLAAIKKQVSENVKSLFSEDIYHKIGKENNNLQNYSKYNLKPFKITLPIDVIPEISGKELVGNIIYSSYLQELKSIFINRFFAYKLNPYKFDLSEIQQLSENLEKIKNKYGINTAILSNSIEHILIFKEQDDPLVKIFKNFEIIRNNHYQDFTVFLNKNKFHLYTEFEVEIQKPTERDIHKCISSREGEIKILKMFTNTEELRRYCQLSRINIIVNIKLNIYTEKINNRDCGVILIER